MVSKVYAKSAEMELIFEHVEGDNWKVVIPRNVYGQYYLDLYAVDTAGNEFFMTKALFEVDPFTLCGKITLFESEQCISFKTSDYEFVCKEVRCI